MCIGSYNKTTEHGSRAGQQGLAAGSGAGQGSQQSSKAGQLGRAAEQGSRQASRAGHPAQSSRAQDSRKVQAIADSSISELAVNIYHVFLKARSVKRCKLYNFRARQRHTMF